MTELDKMLQLMKDTSRDLAQIVPDPILWDECIIYLLQALELQAMELDTEHPEAIELTFENIRDSLAGRLQEGQW